MNLESMYYKVAAAISELDFSRIWPGFEPIRFAFFDDKQCFFDGKYIKKTDEFCANTSIVYEGEQIATWMLEEELEISVLASKIVHEMFHGYQTLNGWDCWPNEIEALYRYEYNAENLSLRLRENELLLALLDRFNEASLQELLALRRLRSGKFPYQFLYEMQTEEIEGTANYVEWQVLKQLDAQRADRLADQMRAFLTKPENHFPVRISCYYTGVLMINALLDAGTYHFDASKRPAILALLDDVEPFEGSFPGEEETVRKVSDAVGAFIAETESIIRTVLERNEIVLEGPHRLEYVNIYDARCLNGYLTSTYFLSYRDGEEVRMIPGNFVIRMQDERTIGTVYRWK